MNCSQEALCHKPRAPKRREDEVPDPGGVAALKSGFYRGDKTASTEPATATYPIPEARRELFKRVKSVCPMSKGIDPQSEPNMLQINTPNLSLPILSGSKNCSE